MVNDADTGVTRCQTPAKLKAQLKQRKSHHYQMSVHPILIDDVYLCAKSSPSSHAPALQSQARTRAHKKRGTHQGSWPKGKFANKRARNCLKWRRIIRAVHWRRFSEIRLFCQALDLSRHWSPGDNDVPKWVHSMYSAMKM
jgi:hypothetical protein